MKIVNILFNFKKSENEGHILGVERCFIDYAKYLIELGHDVNSITKNGMVYCKDIREAGSELLEVPAINQADFFSIFRMTILFFKFGPDIAICHSKRAMFFARAARFLSFRKFPIVAIDHGVNPTKFMKADYVLTVNSFFSKELVKAGKAADRALVIPNMYSVPEDFVNLQKPNFRKPLRLGSLGRLYPEKNFDKVIKAMAILKERGIETNFEIGGIGIEEEKLNKLAKKLGLENNFKILGWTTKKREFFDSIDIFILPSWGETFGIVLLEAMLYSTPIITSNSWGPEDIIDHEKNGLKVSRDNPNAVPELIANAVEKLNNDQEFAKELAKNAQNKFFKNYTPQMVIKKLDNILNQIIRHKKN